jgi:hypothetical protein
LTGAAPLLAKPAREAEAVETGDLVPVFGSNAFDFGTMGDHPVLAQGVQISAGALHGIPLSTQGPILVDPDDGTFLSRLPEVSDAAASLHR